MTQRGPVYKAVRHSTAHKLLSHRWKHPIITKDAFWKFSKTCPNNIRSMFPCSCPNIFLSVQPEDFSGQAVGWNDQPGSQKSQITTDNSSQADILRRQSSPNLLSKFSLPNLRYIIFDMECGELHTGVGPVRWYKHIQQRDEKDQSVLLSVGQRKVSLNTRTLGWVG